MNLVVLFLVVGMLLLLMMIDDVDDTVACCALVLQSELKVRNVLARYSPGVIVCHTRRNRGLYLF